MNDGEDGEDDDEDEEKVDEDEGNGDDDERYLLLSLLEKNGSRRVPLV
jgi:hypothetical protein